jgi:dipeptidyl aminopeptidase/acylaminoacyl peptidase
LAGRIAFPVDDGGGYYDVWVVELPDGEPFLVQPRARQPNFSNDGRLLVKSQGSNLGESIGLLDANYVWQGIVNESPEDSYPFWDPEGNRYTYSNSNLVKDPDTAHLAPFIFTSCSLQIPRFEEREKCQDTRRWGKIEVGDAPVWAEGDQIAFFSYKGDDGIYLVRNVSLLREAGGLAPSRLLVRSNGRPTDTAGSQLFFSAGDIDENWEAYAINLDGSNLTNLSNSPSSQDGLPAVSPDGEWVAFVSNRDGRWGIWVVPRSGGRPLKVVDISRINTNPNPWGSGDRNWMMERISWGP